MTSLALNILDIVQNSIRAKATLISITLTESVSADKLQVIIEDNGEGMSPELAARASDPFTTSRTTRKTGLGLPLLKHHAELTGGKIEIASAEGLGTKVTADFTLSHFDRQPLGDIAGVMIILIAANPEIDFLYTHKTDSGEYVFSTRQIKEYLEISALNEKPLLDDLKRMIEENLTEIGVKSD